MLMIKYRWLQLSPKSLTNNKLKPVILSNKWHQSLVVKVAVVQIWLQGGGTQPENISKSLSFIKDYIKIYNLKAIILYDDSEVIFVIKRSVANGKL